MTTANDERIKNLQHALRHLTANKINIDNPYPGSSWYSGDRDNFIRRHNKSILYLRGLLADLTGPTGSDETKTNTMHL